MERGGERWGQLQGPPSNSRRQIYQISPFTVMLGRVYTLLSAGRAISKGLLPFGDGGIAGTFVTDRLSPKHPSMVVILHDAPIWELGVEYSEGDTN